MDQRRADLIRRARDDEFRGPLQHCRDWADIDYLLTQLANELEEAEREVEALKILRESAT